MAILRPNEIRDMSIEEMKAKLAEIRTELAREKAVAAAGGTLDNPGRVQELKKTVARILTIIKEAQEEREVNRA